MINVFKSVILSIASLNALILTSCDSESNVNNSDRRAFEGPIQSNVSEVSIQTNQTSTEVLPLASLDPTLVCEGVTFHNQNGEVLEGQAICSDSIANLSAENIRSGVTIAGVTGNLVPSPAECAEDGEEDCVTTEAFRAADTSLLAEKIAVGNTVAGIEGTFEGIVSVACTSDGQVDCLAVESFPAMDSSEAESKILAGQVLGGVSGNVTLPLASHVLTGTSFGVAGISVNGGLTLPASTDVRVSNGSFGIGGDGSTPSLADCSEANQMDCVATTNFRTMDVSNIGGLPSLDNATFNAKIKSTAEFVYWTSTGMMQVQSGSNSITEENIRAGVTIFATQGELDEGPGECTGDGQTDCVTTEIFKSADTLSIDTWDIRGGASIGGVTGALRTNCRNPVNLTVYQMDDDFGTAQWWDTIDNYNDNGPFPNAKVDAWSESSFCDQSGWQDVTPGGLCDLASRDCIMRDRVTQLMWTQSYPVPETAATHDTLVTWDEAVSHCDQLNYGGFSDWRLPTQMEFQAAYMHGIRELGYKGSGDIRPSENTLSNNDFFISDVDGRFWAATTVSDIAGGGFAWLMSIRNGTTQTGPKDHHHQVICIR